MSVRYFAKSLRHFAEQILSAAGMDGEMAAVVAEILVEGDLLGHDTHGLALLAPYVREIRTGSMTASGLPDVLSDRGAALLWDGRRLPGPWLVRCGLEALEPRARQYGTATLVIRRSHHIACLAAYLAWATERGLMVVLTSSDPAGASVAPHGGTSGVFTPNPIAAGIPTSSTPFMVDISASMVTNGLTARMDAAGMQYAYDCLLDAQGHSSRDPGVLSQDPPGTILPLGGLESGHKGYGLALLIEALTGGLAAHGRAEPPEGWGATVFLSLYDPEAFGGLAGFTRETDWLGDACRQNPPRPGAGPVRMPGDRGAARKQEQLRNGLTLHPSIIPQLETCGREYGVSFP